MVKRASGVQVHVRLPAETLAEVDAYASEVGLPRSAAVCALMAPTLKRRATRAAKGAA